MSPFFQTICARRKYLNSCLNICVSANVEKDMSLATELKGTQFTDEVLNSPSPVLVDFWAPWCGPCKRLGPELDAVATELGAQLKVVKINVDDDPEIAQRYGVSGIPNMTLFKGGKVVDQLVGLAPRATITAMVKRHL